MDEELVAYQRKMLREDGEQMDHGFVLFGADDAGLEVGFLQFAQIHLPTPVGELLHCAGELRLGRLLHEDLPRLEEAEQFVANGDGDAGVAKARETFHRARAAADLFGDLLLGFEAGRAGAVALRHDDAKGIFGFLAVMGTLPRLDRAQAEGQARRFAESPFVILIDLGLRQGFDEFLILASFHNINVASQCEWDKPQKAHLLSSGRPKEDDHSATEAEQGRGLRRSLPR